MKASQAISFLLASLAGTASADSQVVAIHGSGTTNPSKCIWHVMSLFEERSRVKTHLTYRAVGSSTGQLEFLGADNAGTVKGDSGEDVDLSSHVPYNDFGAGDIPIPKAAYDKLNSAAGHENSDIVHLPFAMSSVSFFHNIAGVPDGEGGIKLSPCLLARIFMGKIRNWDDSEILEENKDLEGVLSGPIFVAHRVEGSSSTKSITKFMNSKCSKEWPDEFVASKLSKDTGNNWADGTWGCQGSGGMTDCIRENAGAIGYIDSGHGWAEELKEVNVQNEDGKFLTSRQSRDKDGIAAAALRGEVPPSLTADWDGTNFLNREGPNTWPIVVMSYFYIRTDIYKFVPNQEERGLLKIFLESMYDDNYFGNCEDLGFSAPPSKIKDMAKNAIDNIIKWEFTNDYKQWSFETAAKTLKIVGQGEHVISAKRRSLAGVSIENIAGAEKRLKGDLEYLKESFHELFVTEEGELRDAFAAIEEEKKRTQAALVLAALSWSMWMCVFVGWLVLKVFRRK